MVAVLTADDDFSGRRSPRRWGLWLCVLLLHIFVIMGLNAVLTLNRLSAQENLELQAVIIPPDVAPIPPKAPKSLPQVPSPEPEAEPIVPLAISEPESQAIAQLPSVPIPEAAASESLVTTKPKITFQYQTPQPIRLTYEVIKGGDSAKASLTWNIAPTTDASPLGYELIYEATYFGFSAIKQTSIGQLGDAGLIPIRFGDKRRGKSEQATHFERDKALVTFSNNHPDASLLPDSQDRVSVFVQLASIFSAQSNRLSAGNTIELPVASVNELEPWVFEVQAKEVLQLPAGEMEAVKLIRRPRRQYDQTVELWLAPQASYLPVRIRLSDTSGITDQLLRSIDKP